jgi:hypothetical protein
VTVKLNINKSAVPLICVLSVVLDRRSESFTSISPIVFHSYNHFIIQTYNNICQYISQLMKYYFVTECTIKIRNENSLNQSSNLSKHVSFCEEPEVFVNHDNPDWSTDTDTPNDDNSRYTTKEDLSTLIDSCGELLNREYGQQSLLLPLHYISVRHFYYLLHRNPFVHFLISSLNFHLANLHLISFQIFLHFQHNFFHLHFSYFLHLLHFSLHLFLY